ncbi:iron-sulfur cluster repair di-iron protein [Persicobacter diffluens]|uniref:Iron-sulfur cluster repair di-iron protein n=1 Tax=Persicobacter diffluens TaxID=981 RepID=A0AAN4W2H8_9BACT|nr:iron-sulfur cluster repair di-iron protein [Persicobacter diffluens]
MEASLSNQKIGQLVAQDYRLAAVFKNFQMDYCCGGDISIKEACQRDGVSEEELTGQLAEVMRAPKGEQIDFDRWPLDLLADYIEKTHHRYVRQQIPQIQALLKTIVEVHGEHEPHLAEIQNLFEGCAQAMTAHLAKEEIILFPFVREIAENPDAETLSQKDLSGPLAEMEEEHDGEGNRFKEISRITNAYTPPKDACPTYQQTYAMLKDFEDNLHQHVHLENNMLFPKTRQQLRQLLDQ